MRLPDFVEQNQEAVLVQWEAFARSLWKGAPTDPATLRDHAADILRATVVDMRSGQTLTQQLDKSKGDGSPGSASDDVDAASDLHASDRVSSGFFLTEVVAEYRALRASVLRLWRESQPTPGLRDLDDVTRFNESIDQSLTTAIDAYARHAERTRTLLADEQAARAGAEAANRAKDAFLATLGHEMRSPLNAIVAWAHILGAGTCTKAEVQQGVEVIKRNAASQTKLIDEVLDVSRIVSGKLKLQIVASDLVLPIGEAIDATRAAADAKNITVSAQLDPAARSASIDNARFQQIVWNLLSNAVKFTPAGGHVAISLSGDGSTRVIRVTDTGIGIAPQFLPRVFDRFWQVDDGSRRQFPGLGLGLSIVKHLVELHGGVVEASSEGPGRGSTFTVRLPVSERAEQRSGDEAVPGSVVVDAEAADTRGEPVALDGLRVLLVEDDADARDVLARLLEGAGALVTAVGSAAEAMDILSNGTGGVDVLVSDLGMPGQDGFDLIRQVRSHGHDGRALPAVALTAFVGTSDQRSALEAGFQVHIAKPVDPRALNAAIARLAGRPRDP